MCTKWPKMTRDGPRSGQQTAAAPPRQVDKLGQTRSPFIRIEASEEVRTLSEGDAVGALVIKEISPSAVLFEAGEVEVRRRVGAGS